MYIYIYMTKLSIVWEVPSVALETDSVQASAGNVSQHVDEARHQCRGSNAYRDKVGKLRRSCSQQVGS